MAPAIYTIAADRPFLDTLAAGLMRRAGGDPLALARMTVLLPTRRAGRSLREAFLRIGAGKAMLLPKMMPVGDLDPEDLAFAPDEGEASDAGFDLPPAIPDLRRRLMLARLVLKFAESRGERLALGQAAPLAGELGRFLDEVQAEGCDFSGLAALVPDRYAEHWQQILTFLGIVTEQWPKALAEIGCLDPAERRNRLLAAQGEAWRAAPPQEPVVAAGVTGGIPAVAHLMAIVALLPQGAVVLPGFDVEADGASWEEIDRDPSHPQYLMLKFLQKVEVEPKDVQPWTRASAASPRAALVREALAPAALSHRWRHIKGWGAHALKGMRRLDCPGPQEEALAIALLLRERLEKPGQTAALVTPDRDLARRVAAELRRWSIDIDDSAGVRLNRTPPGLFLRLTLELAAAAMAPVPLLAALKHPLAACGMAPARFRDTVRRLELAVLRGPRPEPGIKGLRALLPKDDTALADLIARLDAATKPLVKALGTRSITLAALVGAHVAAAEALAASDDEAGPARLWREAAGEAASLFVNELLQAAADFPALAGADYPALFEALVAGPVVRPPYGRHPRLFIWGLLEARLQHADLLVLGGLNEGAWPRNATSDPWLSRPMREAFGMPPPERRIGTAALDFALALGASEVVLTRATRVEGTPTVPSRWLLRLDTVLRAAGLDGRLDADAAPLDWQRLIDAPTRSIPMAPPAPCPPLAARPRQLSVTEIETWMRDPYAIYARHVLKLRALEPLDEDPGVAERGIIIHGALAKFLKKYPKRLPKDAAAALVALGRDSFGDALARPGVWAFWWPRFQRIADWVAAEEIARRPLLDEICAEITGRLTIEGPAGPFALIGRADRVERRRDSSAALIDYKTGTAPPNSDVAEGYAPQLPLEAAMVEAGGFAELGRRRVAELAYWRLTGGDPAGEMKFPERDPLKLAALIAATLAGLKSLIVAFDDPATPYRAVPTPDRAPRYSDYAHLERVKEWLAGKDGEE
jgi:ATP-dependent helicase/nuclease subunit B